MRGAGLGGRGGRRGGGRVLLMSLRTGWGEFGEPGWKLMPLYSCIEEMLFAASDFCSLHFANDVTG